MNPALNKHYHNLGRLWANFPYRTPTTCQLHWPGSSALYSKYTCTNMHAAIVVFTRNSSHAQVRVPTGTESRSMLREA